MEYSERDCLELVLLISQSNLNGNGYAYREDARASVTNIIDSAGNIALSYTYDAYGNTTASNNTFKNSFAYTGAVIDTETGLYYMNARYYDPVNARFISVDPAKDGGNYYAYCDSDPVNFCDPTGQVKKSANDSFLDALQQAAKKATRALARAVIGNIFGVIATQLGLFPDLFWKAGFFRDSNGIYHTRQDSWQKDFGYNSLYDFMFDMGTDMKTEHFDFTSEKKNYRIWAWKGDYLNLGAGAEIGIYQQTKFAGYYIQHWEVNKSLAMSMSLALNYTGYSFKRKTIITYNPWFNVWWLTGFNPFYQNVSAKNLTATYVLRFGKDKKQLFADFYNQCKDKRWSFLASNYIATFTF